ncbi:MAG TPA: ATP-binding protein [Gaiellaceae bacterium]|nr:ATP-binding protein [Gaiellaceae bacterium]
MSTTLHDDKVSGSLAATWEVDLDYLTLARYTRLVVERGLEHVAFTSWATERMTLEGLFDHAFSTLRDRSERAALLDLSEEVGAECLVHLSLVRGRADLHVAARSVDTLAEVKTWLQERYPITAPTPERQAVQLSFWASGSRGASRSSRRIDVPHWDQIAGNYPRPVADPLGALMGQKFELTDSGRLILWHGEPGTGKTFALRALAWEWRDWCGFHYITDPETFFGSSPKYMLDVLLADDEDDDEKWRLLILEDTGELLAADAKYQTGQGLSRLLNVVDGLLGQGLRILVLVTTNDALRRLHPAVSRPGRCASRIEFVPFTPEEAQAWLDRNGGDGSADTGTLAALYARSAGVELPRRQKVGFVW